MRVYTEINYVWNGTEYVLESCLYQDYTGPVALACGATAEQKNILAGQSELFNSMRDQAQMIFGNSSTIFNDLVSSFAPIVAAGINQEGFSLPEKAALQSQAITNVGQAYRNASTAAKEAQAAVGGGNMALPGGATIGQNVAIANAGAAETAKQLTDINLASKQLGRQNFLAASGVLGGAPSVFNPATGASSAAVGAGEGAAKQANEVAQADNSWTSALMGALGGVAEMGLNFLAPGAGTALGAITGGGNVTNGGMEGNTVTSGFPGFEV